MNISEFLLKKGYELTSSTVTPKGRGKSQYNCIINKKPTEEDILEMEEEGNITILKCNFKKGKELSILSKVKEKKPTEPESQIKDISLDDITDMLHNVNMTREDMRDKLSMFQSSAYTKGYNAHKNAIYKLLSK